MLPSRCLYISLYSKCDSSIGTKKFILRVHEKSGYFCGLRKKKILFKVRTFRMLNITQIKFEPCRAWIRASIHVIGHTSILPLESVKY